jgi:hypothetical protein
MTQHEPETSTNDDGRTTSPGDAAGVPVPSEDALPGSSETFPKADGIYTVPDSVEDQESDADLPTAGDYKDLSK